MTHEQRKRGNWEPIMITPRAVIRLVGQIRELVARRRRGRTSH
ncbi:MAG TPA: hypothetical protein VFA56_12280 [Gaiellaceae bacterium]|nr:hypothetical protein [Gaiellaceae bacterium]